MSNDATFGQATHTLTVIDQQKPSTQDLKVLHDGYLADLLRAIKPETNSLTINNRLRGVYLFI